MNSKEDSVNRAVWLYPLHGFHPHQYPRAWTGFESAGYFLLVVEKALLQRLCVLHWSEVERRAVAILVEVRHKRVERLGDLSSLLGARLVVEVLLSLARLGEVLRIVGHVLADLSTVRRLADVGDTHRRPFRGRHALSPALARREMVAMWTYWLLDG